MKDYGTGSTAAVTISEYYKLSRKIAEYSPNFSADKSHGTLTEYYPSGSVKTQTDALRNTIKYEYGYLNKLTKTYTPFNGKEKYSITENQYDKNGNIVLTRQTVQKQDSDKAQYSITQNKYNAMGLLEQVTLSGTGSKDKNISKYFYNNAGVQIKMYTGMSSENDTSYLTTNYEYDNWLRVVRNTVTTHRLLKKALYKVPL